MGLNKIGVVKDIVESIGMKIGHAYENLVFLDHNAFILQFTEEDDKVTIHSNSTADKTSLKSIISLLQMAAQNREMIFSEGSDYSLSQVDDENLRLEFMTNDI